MHHKTRSKDTYLQNQCFSLSFERVHFENGVQVDDIGALQRIHRGGGRLTRARRQGRGRITVGTHGMIVIQQRKVGQTAKRIQGWSRHDGGSWLHQRRMIARQMLLIAPRDVSLVPSRKDGQWRRSAAAHQRRKILAAQVSSSSSSSSITTTTSTTSSSRSSTSWTSGRLHFASYHGRRRSIRLFEHAGWRSRIRRSHTTTRICRGSCFVGSFGSSIIAQNARFGCCQRSTGRQGGSMILFWWLLLLLLLRFAGNSRRCYSR